MNENIKKFKHMKGKSILLKRLFFIELRQKIKSETTKTIQFF